MIVFENPGLLDLQLITTFGASVKESKNPIGQFGTGLKYAIAVLLRNKQQVMMFVGGEHYSFSTKTSTIRGKDFELVVMHKWGDYDDMDPDSPYVHSTTLCGFTTELGKHWELWMAYRELACNCMDEAGTISKVEALNLDDNKCQRTFICVTGAAFEQVYSERKEYILEHTPHFTLPGRGIEGTRQQTKSVFYKGIRVHESGTPFLFQWNFTRELELTEDRTLKHSFMVEHHLSRALIESNNAEMLHAVLTAPKGTFEHGLMFTGMGTPPSETFLQVVRECYNKDQTKVNESAVAVLRSYEKAAFRPTPLTLSIVQGKMLEKAIHFCRNLNLPVSDYSIKVVESLGESILGQAIDDTIYVSARVLETGGTKMLAATLMEEFVHLRYGYTDCTRELQQFLFDKVISMGEEARGEPL